MQNHYVTALHIKASNGLPYVFLKISSGFREEATKKL